MFALAILALAIVALGAGYALPGRPRRWIRCGHCGMSRAKYFQALRRHES